VRASDDRNLRILHVQPADCVMRPRSPSTEPISSPENSPWSSQDENQNSVKDGCRPALDRAMTIISNRGPDPHQCCFCGTIFPNVEILEAHRKLPHPHTCDECPRRFATHSELHRHHLHPEGLAISSSSSDSGKSLYPEETYSQSRETDDRKPQSLKRKNQDPNYEGVRKTQIIDKTEPTIVFVPEIITLSDDEGDEDDNDTASSVFIRVNISTDIPEVSEDIKREDQTLFHDDNDTDKSKDNGLLQHSSDPLSSPFLDQAPVHNSHEAPSFLQSSNAEKDKICGDQGFNEFNDFLTGVVTISSDIESDSDEAPDVPDESITISKVFLQKSSHISTQIHKEESDALPDIEPKIEIKVEENLGTEPPIDSGINQEHLENDQKNNPPPDQNQNQSNDGHVMDKCVQCGVPISKSNFASRSREVMKCFQCQPQIFFQTQCPICEEEVETVNIQYHLEHSHHEVDVVPCKLCQQMIGKHDIIPHMKVCGENGGKPKVLCPLCKKDMLKTSLALHMQTHMNRPKQQCPHCDSRVLDLKMHIKRKHANVDKNC